MLKIVNGDLLEATEEFIGHQCNCVSLDAAGIAKQIFDKYPYADCYSIRWKPDVPGTINVLYPSTEYKRRGVINMFGQYYPGKFNDKYLNDSEQKRKEYFISCLKEIKKLNIKEIAFPHLIGCGIAAGNWDFYKKIIDKFSESINITLYQK